MQRVKSINCKVNLTLIVGDWTYAILFVGLCHMPSHRCICQWCTIRWLLSDILGLVLYRLLFYRHRAHKAPFYSYLFSVIHFKIRNQSHYHSALPVLGNYSLGKCSKFLNTSCQSKRPGQTGKTQIRLLLKKLLKKQSAHSPPCLLFWQAFYEFQPWSPIFFLKTESEQCSKF